MYLIYVCAQSLSRVQLFVTPWTVAHQAPLSMEFSRQEHWSGLIFPSPGDLPDPGMKPSSPMCLALAGSFFTNKPPGKPNLKAAYCTPWRREVTCKRWCFTKKIWEVWKRKNPKDETGLRILV